MMKKISAFTLMFLICLSASPQNVKLKKVKDEYSNGQLKAKGKATPSDFGFGNKKYGEWEFYYENGNLKELSNWEDDSRVGSFISYFENGKVKAKGNYNNGNRNGLWEFFYKSGKPRLRCSFANGEESGNWLEFFDNGNEKFKSNTTIYPDPISNGKMTYLEGEYKEYYNNGNLKSFGNCKRSNYDYDVMISDWYVIDLKGNNHYFRLKFSKQGNWKFYHPNGNIESEGKFFDNHKTGKWKYYDNDGNLINEDFEDGNSIKNLLSSKDGYDHVNPDNAMVHAKNGYAIKDPTATYYMALNYAEGLTVEKNEDEAIWMIETAYKLGSSDAAFYKAVKEEEINNLDQARSYYEKAIEWDSKNADALYNLSAYYYNKFAEIYNKSSDLTDTDKREIVSLLKKADNYLQQNIAITKSKQALELKNSVDEFLSIYNK